MWLSTVWILEEPVGQTGGRGPTHGTLSFGPAFLSPDSGRDRVFRAAE
jgi:hypothetical protein